MPRKGWFDIPGVQSGDRTLEEQMRGLEPAIAIARGKTVYDFGCAEGLIAIEFAKAGADVLAYDVKASFIALARRLDERQRVEFRAMNLRPAFEKGIHQFNPRDIVLALAFVHKMVEPALALSRIAPLAKEWLLLRADDTGRFRSKHVDNWCDSVAQLSPDFDLVHKLPGPRDEIVYHWRRR